MINNEETLNITFKSKHVMVGDHVSGESEVIISSVCLMFWAKNVATNTQTAIMINPHQIGKVVYCTSDHTNVLLIYPTPEAVQRVQIELNLTPEKFRGLALNQRFSRIFLVMDATEQTNGLDDMLEKIYQYKVDMMDLYEAKKVLNDYQELLPKITKPVIPDQTRKMSLNVHETPRIILRYPPNSRGCVSIFSNDYLDLAPMTYLNDAIIDFYIKYLTLEKISQEDRKRIHIFDSFFYKKLSLTGEKEPNDPSLTSEEKAWKKYKRVEKWDEKVNLFSKDFIFVPINMSEHWFLAVICYPYLEGQTPRHYSTNEEVNTKLDKYSPIRQSCILIFDSLGIERPNVLRDLRSYLRQRYLAEHDGMALCNFDRTTMPGCYVKGPRQQNYFDCGIFLLQYVESFLLNPIEDFRTPIKELENWFEQDVIHGKRQFLKDLIESLVRRYEPSNLPLPFIDFNCNIISQEMEVVEIDDEGPSKQEDKDWKPYNLVDLTR